MKKTNKKGFTLVELLVVIAIVAILATVAIIGYTSFTNKANVSNDKTLVAQLNKAVLRVEGKYESMYEVAEAVKAQGFDVEKMQATAKDHEIIWDMTNQKFIYSEEDHTPGFDLWIVSDEVSEDYATYFIGNEIDVDYAAKICVVTNGTDLLIDAPEAYVEHYGDVANLTIEAVASTSYHEFGRVSGLATVKKGHVVVESTGSIGTLVVETTEVTLTGNVGFLVANSDEVAEHLKGNGHTNPITVSQEIINSAYAYIGGVFYNDFATALAACTDVQTVVLLKDVEYTENKVITINAEQVVTIDLNGHVISGVAAEGESSAVITNYGTLTIKDSVGGGKIVINALNPDEQDIPGYASNTITNAGKLVLESGMLENMTSDGRCACAVDNVESGQFIMNGGTLLSHDSYAIRQYNTNNSGNNTVEINGGRIEKKNKSLVLWLQDGDSANMGGTLTIKNAYIDGTVLFGWYGDSSNYNITIKDSTIGKIWIYSNCTISNENIVIENNTYISEGLVDER